MKYFNIIPLIGSIAIANIKSIGSLLTAIFSFSTFKENESYLKSYIKSKEWDIPYFTIQEDKKDYDKTFDEIKNQFQNWTDVDFVSTVCPCAGMSTLNTSRGEYSKGSNAPQNQWIYKTIDAVLNNIKPKVFWGENAPALFNIEKEDLAIKMNELAKKFGYSFLVLKTNTQLHGIP
jgi:site-specific DNA-cytosine methylase